MAAQPTGCDSAPKQGTIVLHQSMPTLSPETAQQDEADTHPNVSRRNWDLRHFQTLMTLGKGNYATVYLVESLQNKQLFAMKARSKKFVYESSETEYINAEKTILLLARREKHPFVVEVFGGHQTESHILFYLEFCQGGSLFHHINNGAPFEVARAR
jgi:serine/threonine protein kinase